MLHSKRTVTTGTLERSFPLLIDILQYNSTCTWYVCMYYLLYGHHVQQSMDRPGNITNPERDQLNRENYFSRSPLEPENLISRDRLNRPFRVSPLVLHTQDGNVAVGGIGSTLRLIGRK